jgi:hypothetical protein
MMMSAQETTSCLDSAAGAVASYFGLPPIMESHLTDGRIVVRWFLTLPLQQLYTWLALFLHHSCRHCPREMKKTNTCKRTLSGPRCKQPSFSSSFIASRAIVCWLKQVLQLTSKYRERDRAARRFPCWLDKFVLLTHSPPPPLPTLNEPQTLQTIPSSLATTTFTVAASHHPRCPRRFRQQLKYTQQSIPNPYGLILPPSTQRGEGRRPQQRGDIPAALLLPSLPPPPAIMVCNNGLRYLVAR